MLGRTIYWHCLALPKIMNGYQQIVEKSEREQRDNLAWQITNAPKLVHVAENSKIQRTNWAWRSSHTPCREHVVETWSQDMLQQVFLVWHEKVLLQGQNFVPAIGMNFCVMKQGQNFLWPLQFLQTVSATTQSCLCLNPLCVHQLTYYPWNMCPMRYWRSLSPLYVPTTCPLGTCANLKLLYL